jgi:hypothetical protein
LDLEGTKLTDAGFVALRLALPRTRVIDYVVGQTGISPPSNDDDD